LRYGLRERATRFEPWNAVKEVFHLARSAPRRPPAPPKEVVKAPAPAAGAVPAAGREPAARATPE
ncbi:MAG TPA: hypothetical protein VE913_17570, partial [Longimicrobium sp.]|nr:hypothetical protein [Longimicrobium sp.]